MKNYKPSVLGKVFPDSNEQKGINFMHNKFDKFNELFESLNGSLDKIDDITPIDDQSPSIKVNIVATDDTMKKIAGTGKAKVNGNTLTI